MDITDQEELSYCIEPNNGAGWYWQIVTRERAVVARGVADTEAQARIDVVRACASCRSMFIGQKQA